jgi:hypothetical protein
MRLRATWQHSGTLPGKIELKSAPVGRSRHPLKIARFSSIFDRRGSPFAPKLLAHPRASDEKARTTDRNPPLRSPKSLKSHDNPLQTRGKLTESPHDRQIFIRFRRIPSAFPRFEKAKSLQNRRKSREKLRKTLQKFTPRPAPTATLS